MEFSVPLLAFAILGALVVYKFFIYPTYFSPLARIPAANFSARFSSLWSNYIRWANIENETLYELHNKLGPIVRLGPNELSVNDYEGGLRPICK